MQTLESLGELRGKRVLLRADFNVPLDGSTITDDGRIRAALPTLTRLLDDGARVIVTAHLGRPDGEVKPEFSLRPVAERLDELLDAPITLAPDTVGDGARQAAEQLGDGELLLLENIRFDPRETSTDIGQRHALATELAALAEAFVSDGFGVVHREQASVFEVAKLLPHAAGQLLATEAEALSRATTNPQRPYVVVLGGSKVSDKLGVIKNLLPKADRFLIGGGMVFTFLAAKGYEVGNSLLEEDQLEAVKGYLDTARTSGVEIVLPTDIVVAPTVDADAPSHVVSADQMPGDEIGLDIGPESAAAFAAKLTDARTIVWNGPMGVFELPPFSSGTKTVAQAMAQASGYTIVGGGDSAAAVRQLGLDESAFDHISTGGGASLEFLEGAALPGMTVLED